MKTHNGEEKPYRSVLRMGPTILWQCSQRLFASIHKKYSKGWEGGGGGEVGSLLVSDLYFVGCSLRFYGITYMCEYVCVYV